MSMLFITCLCFLIMAIFAKYEYDSVKEWHDRWHDDSLQYLSNWLDAVQTIKEMREENARLSGIVKGLELSKSNGGLDLNEVGMIDVRKALHDAYTKFQNTEYGIEGKSTEAACQIIYPSWYDVDTKEDFMKPEGIIINAYALGSSRSHYFMYGKEDKEINYYTWESPNPYAKAIEIINKWKEEIENGKD